MVKRRPLAIGLLLAATGLIAAFLIFRPPPKPDNRVQLRVAVAPFTDTVRVVYGKEQGFFSSQGLDVQVKDLLWTDQIEAVASGGCDIAMCTLDEFVAKSRSLDAINRGVVYILPAWIFDGTVFISGPGIKTLAELRAGHTNAEARRLFLEQLRSKKLAIPEGSLFDQAFRRFVVSAGYRVEDFRIVNTSIEVGINSLGDPEVGLVAAAAVERIEAQKRGYKIALEGEDLGVLVLTGFICRKDFYEQHPDQIARFYAGWYKSLQAAIADPRSYYAVMSKYLDERGAKVPTYEEFESTLRTSATRRRLRTRKKCS